MFQVEPNDMKTFVSKNGGRKEKAKVCKENIKTILTGKDEQDANRAWKGGGSGSRIMDYFFANSRIT